MFDPDHATTAACFKLAGEWDFTRRDELQTILRPAESLNEVLLDFSAVTFIDASVLSSLIRLRRRMIERSRLGTIRIIAAGRHIVRLFEICKIQELFELPTLIGNPVGSGLAKLPG